MTSPETGPSSIPNPDHTLSGDDWDEGDEDSSEYSRERLEKMKAEFDELITTLLSKVTEGEAGPEQVQRTVLRYMADRETGLSSIYSSRSNMDSLKQLVTLFPGGDLADLAHFFDKKLGDVYPGQVEDPASHDEYRVGEGVEPPARERYGREFVVDEIDEAATIKDVLDKDR